MTNTATLRTLTSAYPEIAKEYSTKNTRPVTTLQPGSAGKYIWECSTCNHEWAARLSQRTTEASPCPACNKKLLSTSNPELAAEWGTKNTTQPNDHKPGERTRVWWICPVGHDEYQAAIANRRLLDVTCPKCGIAPYSKSVAGVAPELVQEWSPKNLKTARATFAKTQEPAIWECKTCSHEWTTRTSYRVDKDRGCPKCNNMVVADKSLFLLRPELAAEWSPKNGKAAHEIAAGSRILSIWNCPKGHEYQMRPFERTNDGYGCSVCRLVAGSLAAKYPQIAKEFDLARNGGKTAADFMASSVSRVFWKCLKAGHEWEVGIGSRTRGHKTGCPDCVLSGTSRIEEIIRNNFIAAGIIQNIQNAQNTTLPISWRNRSKLNVDIIGEYRNQPIVVEYDGWYWHSGQIKKDSVTPMLRDSAKTQALLDAGYLVVRIREKRNTSIFLDFVPIKHKNLLQFHWNNLQNVDDTTEILKKVHLWLQSQ